MKHENVTLYTELSDVKENTNSPDFKYDCYIINKSNKDEISQHANSLALCISKILYYISRIEVKKNINGIDHILAIDDDSNLQQISFFKVTSTISTLDEIKTDINAIFTLEKEYSELLFPPIITLKRSLISNNFFSEMNIIFNKIETSIKDLKLKNEKTKKNFDTFVKILIEGIKLLVALLLTFVIGYWLGSRSHP